MTALPSVVSCCSAERPEDGAAVLNLPDSMSSGFPNMHADPESCRCVSCSGPGMERSSCARAVDVLHAAWSERVIDRCEVLTSAVVLFPSAVSFCPASCVCVCRFRRLDLHLLPDCSRFTPLNLLETVPNSSSSSAPCLRTRDVFRELQGSAVHTESFNHCNTLPVFNAATRPLFSPRFRFKFFLDSILMFKWNCSKSKIMSSLLKSWGLYKFNCSLLKD